LISTIGFLVVAVTLKTKLEVANTLLSNQLSEELKHAE